MGRAACADAPDSHRPAESGMTESRGSGAPDLDALIAASEAERGKLQETMVVSQAEGTVAAARQADLAAAQLAARRRWSAAKGLLTKAQKNGAAAAIVAARERCDRAYTELTRISDAAIHEMQQITRARIDSLEPLFDQMHRTWAADSAVTDALARNPGEEPPARGSAP